MDEGVLFVGGMVENEVYVGLQEEDSGVQLTETVENVEINYPEPVVVDTQNAFPGLIQAEVGSYHGNLLNLDKPDHPIEAIIGLREELNELEALKRIYSSEDGLCEFHKWNDENPRVAERCGYFVQLVNGTENIEICTETDNVYGVTVRYGGFVGGQRESDRSNDAKYAMVGLIGTLSVRTDGTARNGEYVVPNEEGIATKSPNNYGYKVVSQGSCKQYKFVNIVVTPQNERLSQIQSVLEETRGNVGNIQIKINGIGNDSSNALIIANNANNKINGIIVGQEALQDLVNNHSSQINIIQTNADETERKAQNALDSANSMLRELGELQNDMQVLAEFDDPTSELSGLGGLVSAAEHNRILLGNFIDVSDVDGHTLSSIVQDIGRNQSDLMAIVSGQYDDVYQSLTGEAPPPYAGCDRYNRSPVLNTTTNEFEFSEACKDENGKYYFHSEDRDKYCYVKDEDNYIIFDVGSHSSAMLRNHISKTEAEFESLAEYSTDGKTALAGLISHVDEGMNAQAELIAKVVDEDGNVDAASIIAAINDKGESIVDIQADQINFEGCAAFSSDGTTIIDGSRIQTGTLVAGLVTGDALEGNSLSIATAGNALTIDKDGLWFLGADVDTTAQHNVYHLSGTPYIDTHQVGVFEAGYLELNQYLGDIWYDTDTDAAYIYKRIADGATHYNYYWEPINAAQFKLDSDGVHIVNGSIDITKSGSNNRILLNATDGIKIMKGTTEQLSIDPETGNLKISGELNAATGTFSGTITAGSVISNSTISNGNFTVSPDGDVTMNGSIQLNGSISFGDNNLIEYEYSPNGVSDWSSTMRSTDKYRHEKIAGGSWGSAYQFKGTDGAPGASASLPSWIKTTYIDGSSVTSPLIRGCIISGGRFTNLVGTAQNPSYTYWIEMGNDGNTGQYGFQLWSSAYSNPIFGIHDGDLGYSSFYAKDKFRFLMVDSSQKLLSVNGSICLSSYSYGNSLPTYGDPGRVFFLKA